MTPESLVGSQSTTLTSTTVEAYFSKLDQQTGIYFEYFFSYFSALFFLKKDSIQGGVVTREHKWPSTREHKKFSLSEYKFSFGPMLDGYKGIQKNFAREAR